MHVQEEAANRQLAWTDIKTARIERKPWAEIGLEEKVERIRRELLDQRHLSQAALRIAQEGNELAHSHQHGLVTGEVLKPAHDRRSLSGAECGSGYDALR